MPDPENPSTSRSSRRLAAIMFADIAGYTALMQADEEVALALLNTFKEHLERETAVNQGEIIQYFGDGCVVSFESSTRALHCAMSLQQHFVGQSRVPVRIGLHLGEVLFKNKSVFGDGVNVASRIESLGIPGSILISKAIGDQVKNKSEFHLESLGHFDFKNVKDSMEVFAVVNKGLAVPERKSMTGKLKVPVDGKHSWQRKMLGIALIAVMLALVYMVWFNIKKDHDESSNANKYSWNLSDGELVEKSIAVLPFANMSNLKENEPFTVGIHDDMLTQISKIKDIKVISRTSVMKYSNSTLTSPEIAKELGVSHILEGGVQRAGDQIRINIQLIDAVKDEHVWAETYNRSLSATNIFSIQNEIVQSISNQMKIELTNEEKQSLKKIPTEELEAYDFYVLGNDLISQLNVFDYDSVVMQRTVDYFESAIQRDSNYAEAYSRLGETYALWGYFDSEYRTMYYNRAVNAVNKAISLDPNSSNAHTVLGYVLRTKDWNWKASEVEFKKAIALNPNSSDAKHYYALLLIALGRNDEAIEQINLAFKLDPKSERIIEGVYRIHRFAREYDISRKIYLESAQNERDLAFNAREDGVGWESAYFLYTGQYNTFYHRMIKDMSASNDYTDSDIEQLSNAYATGGIEQFYNRYFHIDKARGVVNLRAAIWGGEHDAAFEIIRQELDAKEGYTVYLKVEPYYDPIRTDPRFDALLGEMGLLD